MQLTMNNSHTVYKTMCTRHTPEYDLTTSGNLLFRCCDATTEREIDRMKERREGRGGGREG